MDIKTLPTQMLDMQAEIEAWAKQNPNFIPDIDQLAYPYNGLTVWYYQRRDAFGSDNSWTEENIQAVRLGNQLLVRDSNSHAALWVRLWLNDSACRLLLRWLDINPEGENEIPQRLLIDLVNNPHLERKSFADWFPDKSGIPPYALLPSEFRNALAVVQSAAKLKAAYETLLETSIAVLENALSQSPAGANPDYARSQANSPSPEINSAPPRNYPQGLPQAQPQRT